MLRLVEPTAGTVIFDGVDVRTLARRGPRRLRRRMQMIFQDPISSLDPRQSVESVLTEPWWAPGSAPRKTRSVSRPSRSIRPRRAAR